MLPPSPRFLCKIIKLYLILAQNWLKSQVSTPSKRRGRVTWHIEHSLPVRAKGCLYYYCGSINNYMEEAVMQNKCLLLGKE